MGHRAHHTVLSGFAHVVFTSIVRVDISFPAFLSI